MYRKLEINFKHTETQLEKTERDALIAEEEAKKAAETAD